MCADVDELLLFRRREWGRPAGWPELSKFLLGLRDVHFDRIIDFQGLLRSGACAAFAGGKETYGFATAREGAPLAYRHRVEVPADVTHAVDKNLLLAAAAFDIAEPNYEPPLFKPDPGAGAAAAELSREHSLQDGTATVAIAPAARWASKQWPPSFFAETITAVCSAADVRFWLLGTDDERHIGEEIGEKSSGNAVNLMGKTDLRAMMQLLKKSSMLLTNDTGPMHISAALGIQTIALFGPTDPDLTGPYGDGHVVFRSKVDCAPCFERECPLAEQLCLFDTVSSAAVSDQILKALNLNKAR
jgi:ADP-heptose:LPS heptosyltransferase